MPLYTLSRYTDAPSGADTVIVCPLSIFFVTVLLSLELSEDEEDAAGVLLADGVAEASDSSSSVRLIDIVFDASSTSKIPEYV